MTNQQPKIDPIRDKYYKPLEIADKWADCLFYIAAAFSIITLLVEKSEHPKIYDGVQIVFVLAVIASFVTGQLIRLYFMPRAEDKRRQDFLSKAYEIPLSHEQTTAYYNNDQVDPFQRVAAQLLENSLFSKTIVLEMTKMERAKVAIYAVVWLIAVLNRSSDLAFSAAAAQAIFSEQIISRWLRIEWLRIRFEKTYDDLYRLFQTRPDPNKFSAMALEAFGIYETGKANGGITLSSKIFERLNPALSQEWQRVKNALGL